MDPVDAANSYAAALTDTVIVTRGLPATATATVRARIMGYTPQELTDTIKQGDSKVILLTADLLTANYPLPLVIGQDRVTFSGRARAVMSHDDGSRRVAGVSIAIDCQVRG